VFNQQKQALIIDPGCYFPAEQEKLATFLTDKNLTPVQLINTHCHLDHVFGNKWVYETYGLLLHIHPLEEKVLSFAPISGEKWGLPFVNYKGPIHFIDEHSEIKIGDDVLKILPTPGHSPGSISLYCKAQNFVIAGDVLFYESIGRTDLPGGNFETLANSIQTQLYTLPDITIVYNGHGEPTTVQHEKQCNPYVKAQ
ncbi:MAG: MBL fold metallo-hydrolase, partial [Chitinophagaceae bacterium]